MVTASSMRIGVAFMVVEQEYIALDLQEYRTACMLVWAVVVS